MPEEAGVRERRRTAVKAALMAAAKVELTRVGAAGLSVRAIARDLDMAPSALFRYISGRDELLTMLIVEAYDALADHVELREADVPRADLRGRWRAIATSFRDWSVAHPHEYALLYGSPVPDFHANAEDTNRAGQRVTDLLAALGRDAPRSANPLDLPERPDLAAFAGASGAEGLDEDLLARGITAWTSLLGAVSAEVFEHLGPALPYSTTIFAATLALGELLLFGESRDESATR
jgi:AcrR family transcriptional regulator